jgi:hypothetical protein
MVGQMMKRLAALISAFSSFAKRSWRVPNMRSERPARFRRVGGNVLDAKPIKRPAHLGPRSLSIASPALEVKNLPPRTVGRALPPKGRRHRLDVPRLT